MLVLLAAYLVFGEFDESDPAQNGSGADSSTASQTADENNGLSENGATQFQAENTDEEELAKRYYYSQLDENRQMIYRDWCRESWNTRKPSSQKAAIPM